MVWKVKDGWHTFTHCLLHWNASKCTWPEGMSSEAASQDTITVVQNSPISSCIVRPKGSGERTIAHSSKPGHCWAINQQECDLIGPIQQLILQARKACCLTSWVPLTWRQSISAFVKTSAIEVLRLSSNLPTCAPASLPLALLHQHAWWSLAPQYFGCIQIPPALTHKLSNVKWQEDCTEEEDLIVQLLADRRCKDGGINGLNRLLSSGLPCYLQNKFGSQSLTFFMPNKFAIKSTCSSSSVFLHKRPHGR